MTQQTSRPLSPHLQIYKPQLTSISSILHRITGYLLAVGTVFFAWWIIAAAKGPEAYGAFTAFCGSGLGLFLLFVWSAAFYYHLASGIRHLLWDFGYLLDLKSAYAAGYFVLLFTALMTGAMWFCIYTF